MMYILRRIKDAHLLFAHSISFSGNHFVHLKLFLLVKANPFNGNCSYYWNPFRLFRVVLFSGSCSFQWKQCYIVGISLSGSHFAYLKSPLSVVAIPFNISCSCQWKPFRLFGAVFQWKSFLLVEAAFFSESRKQKPFLLLEAYPFNGSCSSQ